MNNEEREDNTIYKVVVNHEEQYSIWFVDRQPPLGWREVGKIGLEDRVSGLYHGSLERHAPAQSKEAIAEAAEVEPS
jgi:hypothetical protein